MTTTARRSWNVLEAERESGLYDLSFVHAADFVIAVPVQCNRGCLSALMILKR